MCIFKRIILIFITFFLSFSLLAIDEYKKYFDRKLEPLEGIWKYSHGCITYFIYDKNKGIYKEVSLSGCRTYNKIISEYRKLSDEDYSGETMVYYDNGAKKWSPSELVLNYNFSKFKSQSYRNYNNGNVMYFDYQNQPPLKIYPRNLYSHNSKYEKEYSNSEEDYNYQNPDDIVAASSGSGFLINYEGYIISNNHVTKGCDEIEVYYDDNAYFAEVINLDSKNDISVLKTSIKPKNILAINYRNPKLLEEIFVAGYPFGNRISSGVKVTKGIVSSLTGIGNNYANMQIDAAIQAGNSGGPVIDIYGNVLGVAVEKLNYKAVIDTFGDLPENTNFGIKSNIIRNFVEANGISLIEPNKNKISLGNLGQKITDTTVYISCLMSYANIKKFKSKKVLFKKLNDTEVNSINKKDYKKRKQEELNNIDSMLDRS